MNLKFIASIISIIGVIVIVAFWCFMDRLKKRIARRCRRKNCGRTDVKRVGKILLPPDESISWRSPEGKRRWFIRRPIKLTFAVCKCGWVELVKIDTDPISVWHSLYVKKYKPEQYNLDEWRFIEATERKLRQLYLGSGRRSDLDPQASDTPPISLQSLFEDYWNEISEVIEID